MDGVGECVPKYIYECVCASGAAEEQGTHSGSVADFDTNVPDLVFFECSKTSIRSATN